MTIFNTKWTKKFSDIYPDLATFTTDFNTYKNMGLNPGLATATTINTIYFLLIARYTNSTIASFDENQFKIKLFSKIWQYAPTWEKELDIQAKLRALSEDDLRLGTRQVHQHAYNPSTDINTGMTGDTGEIDTTNEQTRSWFRKSKADGYAILMALLKKDVTEEFLTKFRDLFLKFLGSYKPLFYETEIEEEGDNI